ncbi:MAG: hypothetical protein M3040_08285, partial [Bacteroidota bacterium]|nr:hypothetical protein [Bacteroidota bacterium]
LRQSAVASFATANADEAVMRKIANIATSDPSRVTRATAISVLAAHNPTNYKSIFMAGVNDSSYSVAGASLIALADIDQPSVMSLLPGLKKDAEGSLKGAIEEVEVQQKKDEDFPAITAQLDSLRGFSKFSKIRMYLMFLRNVQSTENFKKGVDRVVALRTMVAPLSAESKNFLNGQLEVLKSKKLARRNEQNAAATDEQVKYLDEKIKG